MSLTTRIIPCLLLRNGRCIKGVQFQNYRDVGNPVTLARIFDAQGADELMFLDISASAEGRAMALDVVRQAADECLMPLAVGGGIRTLEDVRAALNAGADKVVVNSEARRQPLFIKEVADLVGMQSTVLSVDYRLGEEDWARGWADDAVAVFGAGEILLTCVDQEGTRQGYDLPTLREVCAAVPVPVIASGGAGSAQHLVEAVQAGASAVAVGSLLHFQDRSIIQLKAQMTNAGLEVRKA